MNGVIFDTDFIVSMIVKTDTTSQTANELFEQYFNFDWYLTNIVKFEVGTVLSRKLQTHLDAVQVINNIDWKEFKYIVVDESLETQVWLEYAKYEKKNISFTDCANLILAQNLDLKIASFDTFYPKNIRLETT